MIADNKVATANRAAQEASQVSVPRAPSSLKSSAPHLHLLPPLWIVGVQVHNAKSSNENSISARP